jgi:hypothetical protein
VSIQEDVPEEPIIEKPKKSLFGAKTRTSEPKKKTSLKKKKEIPIQPVFEEV